MIPRISLQFALQRQERAQLAAALPKKNVNDLHAKLGHPSKVITHATTRFMDIHVTHMFKPCKDCALGFQNFEGEAIL